MTEPTTAPMPKFIPDNKNQVAGVKVLQRQIARLYVPFANTEDGLVETRGVHHLLLEDGREIYQCFHLNEVDCDYVNENGISVRSHLRTHSDRMMAKRLAITNQGLENQNAQLLREQEEQRKRYSQGAIKGWEKRRAKANGTPTDDTPTNPEDGLTIPQVRVELNNLAATAEQFARSIGQVGIIMKNMADSWTNFQEQIDTLAAAEVIQSTDPELAAKAESWDAMRALLDRDR